MQHFGAKLMNFLPASRTKRNLLKIASLGLAGLIAGLLSGCNGTANASVATNRSGDRNPQLPTSIEATQIPALRHPPSSRSLQVGVVRAGTQATTLPGHS
jgi:hypothetical protein